MANEKLINDTITVYTEIFRRLVKPDFNIVRGGSNLKKIRLFLEAFEHEFGAITSERLVDFCVAIAYYYRDRKFQIGHLFGQSAIKRLKTNAHGSKFYEDRWLKKKNLSRILLVDMIKDKGSHPHAKYIYMPSEETTKQRMLNLEVGFTICQISTLGWSPLSPTCQQCKFIEECKAETQRKFPELFRLRSEYGEQQHSGLN